MITSASNPKIKETLKLRESKHRRRTKKFLIDGRREINRALQSGIRFCEVFGLPQTLEEFRSRNLPVYPVSESVLQKLAFGDRNEGIIVVAEEPNRSLEYFEQRVLHTERKNPVLLGVLEAVEKPGNLGAVCRSADGAGLDGLIITDPLVDTFHPNVLRSSLGTVFHLPSVTLNPAAAMDWLQKNQIHLALAKCSEAILFSEYNFCQPTAVVLGSEANGLTEQWGGKNTTAISLPMCGVADSLNVSAAAGILFYFAQYVRGIKNSALEV